MEESNGWCPETSWTRIIAIRDEKEQTALNTALEELCEIYRPAALAAFRMKHGFSPEDAEDASQDFLVWLIQSELIHRADRKKGKFRSYFLTCLDNFALNRRRKLNREKGGSKAIHLPTDSDIDIDIPVENNPEDHIHMAWAQALLRNVRSTLEFEEIADGREEEWKIIKNFLSIQSNITIEEAAKKLSISTKSLSTKIHRLRKRFSSLLKRHVSSLVSSELEFNEELNFLREIFA